MTAGGEILVVGAGLVGSSVAMHLAELGVQKIRVIDFDLEGSLSSSELNAGGVRATWLEPLNVQMSRGSINYFSKVAEEVGYRACGYLWLHPDSRMKAVELAVAKQNENGWPVDLLSVKQIQDKIPFLDKTDGVAGGVFSARDGLINPNLLKNHFRARAKKRGVLFEDRALLREARFSESGGKVRVRVEKFEAVMSHETKKEVLTQRQPQEGLRNLVEFEVDTLINCAGPWASDVAKILGYSCPSFPVRRQVSIFDCREIDLTPYGMIVDTSGVYFHPEATNGLAGFATQEPKGYNFDYDGEGFFQEHIWPALYERSSSFEKLKHVTGWAGLYEVSPDECAILGAVNRGPAGSSGRLFEAHSFSGHGVMQSYTAGLGLAEKIVQGKYQTLDLAPLGAERFETGKLLNEKWVI
ncbi:MAG: FAD-binding oxidoreductase [Bdellovibrio sp.]|nr:FAD-binding oxidoreductase [Bdellovibrio sp.]